MNRVQQARKSWIVKTLDLKILFNAKTIFAILIEYEKNTVFFKALTFTDIDSPQTEPALGRKLRRYTGHKNSAEHGIILWVIAIIISVQSVKNPLEVHVHIRSFGTSLQILQVSVNRMSFSGQQERCLVHGSYWKSACRNNFELDSDCGAREAHPGSSHAQSHLWWFLKSWAGAGSIFGQLPCLPYVVGTSRRNQQPGPAGLELSHPFQPPATTPGERKDAGEK